MLPPAQVIPFLTHDEAFVRESAFEYFADANPTAHMSADDLWNAIDRFGLDDSPRLLDLIPFARQTDASLDRLLNAMRMPPPGVRRRDLADAAETVDFELLCARREELLAPDLFPAAVRLHLEQRLVLADEPPAVLWDTLMRHGEESAGKYETEFDQRVAARLVEALSRHPEAVVDRAVAALDDPKLMEDYREIFAVDVLGAARAESAVDALIQKLQRDEDLLPERVSTALVRIGTAQAVQKLAAFCPGREWFVRLIAHDAIGKIKLPESEDALASFLPNETDAELFTWLLKKLCHLGSMRMLEQAREVINAHPADPEVRDLRDQVMSAAIMNGIALPEAAEWTRLARIEQARSRQIVRNMEAPFESIRENTWNDEASRDTWRSPDSLDAIDPVYQPLSTYRRDAPKVGRNERCPCGSGKKYKRCCGQS
jgi:hypothetical protein